MAGYQEYIEEFEDFLRKVRDELQDDFDYQDFLEELIISIEAEKD